MAPSSMAAKPMPPAAPDPGARAAVSAVGVSGAGEGGDEVLQSGVELGDLGCGGAFLGAEHGCGAGESEQRAGDVAGDDELDPIKIDCAAAVDTVDEVQVLSGGGQQMAGAVEEAVDPARRASRFRRRCWRCRPARAPGVCGPASALLGWLRRSRSSTRSSGRGPRRAGWLVRRCWRLRRLRCRRRTRSTAAVVLSGRPVHVHR